MIPSVLYAAKSTDDPRGWWADPTIGSKLWLLARAKRTPQNLQLAIAYIRQALGWLTADGAASAIDVTAEWQAGGRLAGRIVVSHPTGTTAVPFDYAWKDLAGPSPGRRSTSCASRAF